MRRSKPRPCRCGHRRHALRGRAGRRARLFGRNGVSSSSTASSRMMRARSTSTRGKSRRSTTANSSDRAPATSTPVGPPPTTTNVRAPSSTSDRSASAASNCARTWLRNAAASPSVYSGSECSAAPVDAEEVGGGAGGDDEVVEGQAVAVVEQHVVAVPVDAVHRRRCGTTRWRCPRTMPRTA